MSDKIKLLPEIVANQIAAGEVVEEPASVVKEMTENAVDAGAHCIKVNYRNGGFDLLQIADDGCGMSPVDARMAFDRHATSKIKSLDDIYALRTFGFRGEALASIAAVSQVELLTRQHEDETGTETVINGGEFISQKPVMTPAGSQFLVRNLFYNVPARRKFKEEPTKAAAKIRSEFQRVALCNPQVAFELYANDAPIYILPETTLVGRIIDVIGKGIKQNLLEIDADTSIVSLKGYIGRPAAAKKRNSNEQFLFVNGRYFKSSYLNKAILKAYEKLIPEGCFPSYFIYITVDPDRVDVNVSPKKTEVKFADNEAIWQILNAAVRETLAKTGAVPLLDFDDEAAIEIPVSEQGAIYLEPRSTTNDEYNPFLETDDDATAAGGGLKQTDPYGIVSDIGFASPKGGIRDGFAIGGRTGNFASDNTFADIPSASGGGSRTLRQAGRDDEYGDIASSINGGEYDGGMQIPDIGGMQQYDEIASGFDSLRSDGVAETSAALPIPENKASFQSVTYIGNGYASALYGGRFIIADLRRAEERILYENYISQTDGASVPSQRLLFPERLVLSNDEYALLENNAVEFAALGFDIDFEGEGTIEVNGAPADTGAEGIDSLIFELLKAFEIPVSAADIRREKIAASMARCAARKSRCSLTDNEAALLLGRLAESGNISFTPQGKAIITEITPDEIRTKLG
ncbi:MAG: DNA mismatch repair endonuclease MutL [Alistipes sp.]|nr:DNA mismatch repair endonuclease MutL [Alistipes sp.]